MTPVRRRVVVIGGGQSGLAIGYFLRRAGLDFEILDASGRPGGAWPAAWDSLRLFSPAQWSSLPGWPMPPVPGAYPGRDDVVAYLTAYERRYALPVRRPVEVVAVEARAEGLLVRGTDAAWLAQAVVSATGSWRRPVIPAYPGQESFRGRQLHSAGYRAPEAFAGQRVLVVGGGNSGAQILAELSQVATTTWVTETEPRLLPDEVDGRVLFARATARLRAQQEGRAPEAPASGLGEVVAVPPVRAARDRGALRSRRPFLRFEPDGVVWPDGSRSAVDAVIWCTGFRPALDHLAPLGVLDAAGRVAVREGRAVGEPRLWLLGYGDWTGLASATLAGITRTAREVAKDIARSLGEDPRDGP